MNLFRIILVASFFIGISAQQAMAAEQYGPEGKRIGAGLMLGEPMQATVKGYVWNNLAIQAGAGWTFIEEGFGINFDATYEILDLADSGQSTIPLYAGLGFKFTFDQGGADDGDTHSVIRLPIGVALQLKNDPIEFFIEAAPGIELSPDSEFDMTGGIGARFYF